MLLDTSTYLVKERVAWMKVADHYDIFDPITGRQIGIAKEEPRKLVKFLRLVFGKVMPAPISFYESQGGRSVMSMRVGMAPVSTAKDGKVIGGTMGVNVTKDGQMIGSIGQLYGAFVLVEIALSVRDAAQREVAQIKGDWKSWNFEILSPTGQKLGKITKKWAGLGRELFTSADNYIIELAPAATKDPTLKSLLLAAGITIDATFKEK